MGVKQQRGSSGFFVRQGILLAITIILLIFCAIPLLNVVNGALHPGQLETDLSRGKQEASDLERKLEVVEAKRLMGAGQDDAHEKLSREVEELKRQLSLRELENKHLQNQMALVQTMLEVLKTKSDTAPMPTVESGHKFFDLITKVFGCIASLFSGGMFLISWWRKRREPTQNTEN